MGGSSISDGARVDVGELGHVLGLVRAANLACVGMREGAAWAVSRVYRRTAAAPSLAVLTIIAAIEIFAILAIEADRVYSTWALKDVGTSAQMPFAVQRAVLLTLPSSKAQP